VLVIEKRTSSGERREADGVAEHARDDDVVLQQARDEDDEPGGEGDLPGHGEADPDRHRARQQRADHGHDLDDPGEGADQDPVRQPDRPERN
jgi:hypothetical protein